MKTKGPLHSLERAFEVVHRFGRGRAHFQRRLRLIEETFNRSGIRVTFCVTASLLQRHGDLIEELVKLNHEVAAHGQTHTRMDQYSSSVQGEMIRASYQTFQKNGFSVEGFRCPYLNFNEATLDELRKSPYVWTSGEMIWWSNGNGAMKRGVDRLSALYHFSRSTEEVILPSFSEGLVEIPITAPDDELLYERERIRDPDLLLEVWTELFEKSHQKGEIFHLFFHPERLEFIQVPLDRLIREVKSREDAVWRPTLGELAHWWNQRSQLAWEFHDGTGEPRASLKKVPELRVVLQSDGSEELVARVSETEEQQVFRAGTEQLSYSIGLSPDCPEQMERFLQSEGYLTGRSESPERHACYLDRHHFESHQQRSLLTQVQNCKKPLLRYSCWPNAARSAFIISSDICAIDIWDFVARSRHF